MLHEFAVEPRALGEWNPLWNALEQFGIHHGRMISRFPKKWERMVWELLSHCPPVQKAMLTERLRRLKPRLISTGRTYDPTADWFTNAEREHNRRPFRAIICAENPSGVIHVLTDAQMHEGNDLWTIPRERTVPRTARDLADSVAPLLGLADALLFVDPHFCAERRFAEPLEMFLAEAHPGGRKLRRIEFHLEYVDWWTTYCDECRKWLPQRIPTGAELRIVAWRERPGGEKLHPRYVLTDIGGVRFEVGLDSGDQGQTCDVSLLDRELYLQRWSDFQSTTAAFEYKGELRITGT